MIKELAKLLVGNHLRHLRLNKTAFSQIVDTDIIDLNPNSRVLVFVGAGASKHIGLPLSQEACQRIKEKTSMPAEMLEAELDRLSSVYQLKRDALETVLMAICSNPYTALEARRFVKDLYDVKFIPSMCYEILAHLMKHRFIDAIINFNFDELLDKALEDELDSEEYHYILSDGDCPDFLDPNNDSNLPFYIKPHGTVSHSASLRFTREDYFGLPAGITELIGKLIKSENKVAIINIGFALESFEFNKILEDIPKGSQFYDVDIKEKNIKNNRLDDLIDYFFEDVSEITINGFLEKLWRCVDSLFNKNFKPRGILRHRFICDLFEKNIEHDYDRYRQNLKNYFLQRTVAEICLNAAKCKGIMNIAELSRERSGKYYQMFRRHSSNETDPNFFNLCKLLHFHSMNYSQEILKLGSTETISNDSVIKKNDFMLEIKGLFNSIEKDFLELHKKINRTIRYGGFREVLENLYIGQEVEIKLLSEPLHSKIFVNPKHILTSTELCYLTAELLTSSECLKILIVAESGGWLLDPPFKDILRNKPNCSISLIIANSAMVKSLIDTYKDIISDIYKLAWWQHNRHMTITLDNDGKPIASIYFTRRLKNSHITPVLLDKNDTRIIMDAYDAYKNRAEIVSLL